MNQDGRITIGLLWHSAKSGNLGVGALTESNMALARRAAATLGLRPHFVVIGARDQGASYLSGDDYELFPIDLRQLLSPRGYWAQLPRLDCILDISGGDSFADIYGDKAFAFLWLTKAMAIARGVPLLLSPMTIGPFDKQPHRALASWVLNRTVVNVARDPISYAFAQRIAPEGRTVEAVDVAFALPFERPAPRRDGLTHVGVNVSGLLFNEAPSGRNRFGLAFDYALLMRRFIGSLTAREDIRVHLICHVNAKHIPADDDGAVADRLAAEFPNAVRVPDFTSPSDAKSYIASLDLLVAARMHACIAAFSAGVPVIPVAYSRKFAGLFEGVLHYPHMIPVKGLGTDAALARLLDAVERRDALKGDMAVGTAGVENALGRYSAELESLFERVAQVRR